MKYMLYQLHLMNHGHNNNSGCDHYKQGFKSQAFPLIKVGDSQKESEETKMATTNNQIILMECVTRGIIEPVHTYARWKELGFQVQKGQKALFKTAIYKCVEKKDADGNTTSKKMFPKMSAFFGKSQVQPIATRA